MTKRESGSDNDSCSVSDSDEKLEKSLHGFKHPKDDAIIIEEFKELCNSYRDSIKVLLCQLDERNKEITELKVKVKHLEQDKFKGINNTTITLIPHSFISSYVHLIRFLANSTN